MRLNMMKLVVVFAVLAVVRGGLDNPAAGGDNKPAVKLEGKWKYQSYRPEPGSLAADPTNPKFIVWSPPGVVTIDQGGTTGNLEFPGKPIKLKLDIRVMAGSPEKISISAVMKLPEDKQFTNELQGSLVPAKLGQEISKDNPLVVRGSIVQTSDDILPKDHKYWQPRYTTGFFVLEPLK